MQDNVQGNTATHWACLAKNYSVISLLANRATGSLSISNNNREAPLDIVDRFTVAARQKDKKAPLMIPPRVYDKMVEESPPSVSSTRRTAFQRLMLRNRKFRLAAMAVTPFITFWLVGSIFAVGLDYLIKLGLFTLLYMGLALIGQYVFDERMPMLLPLCIYFGTKAWFYILWMTHIRYHVSAMTTFLFLTSSVLLWYNFIKCWRGDAGRVKTSEEERYRTIIEMAEKDGFDHRVFCTSCLIRKPLRSKHCAVCDCCVAKFDHHCPWIGNCVGANNHKYFIGYLLSLSIGAMFTLYGCYMVWLNGCAHANAGGGSWGAVKELAYCDPWVAYLLGNTIVHSVWVVPLTVCQIYQIVILAMTTNERMNAGRYKHFHSNSKSDKHSHGRGAIKSPFDKGCWRNARDFLGWRLGGVCRPTKDNWFKIFSVNDGGGDGGSGGGDSEDKASLLGNEYV
jgi:hypothetical protein